ncbi:hypothetical protein DFJ74DRAFT_710471 [Hyaloraphidium curvatum]|nr:hypothetical protein DFJ74DRAFT_710471 [Hyaloraphidium curvatum]
MASVPAYDAFAALGFVCGTVPSRFARFLDEPDGLAWQAAVAQRHVGAPFTAPTPERTCPLPREALRELLAPPLAGRIGVAGEAREAKAREALDSIESFRRGFVVVESKGRDETEWSCAGCGGFFPEEAYGEGRSECPACVGNRMLRNPERRMPPEVLQRVLRFVLRSRDWVWLETSARLVCRAWDRPAKERVRAVLNGAGAGDTTKLAANLLRYEAIAGPVDSDGFLALVRIGWSANWLHFLQGYFLDRKPYLDLDRLADFLVANCNRVSLDEPVAKIGASLAPAHGFVPSRTALGVFYSLLAPAFPGGAAGDGFANFLTERAFHHAITALALARRWIAPDGNLRPNVAPQLLDCYERGGWWERERAMRKRHSLASAGPGGFIEHAVDQLMMAGRAAYGDGWNQEAGELMFRRIRVALMGMQLPLVGQPTGSRSSFAYKEIREALGGERCRRIVALHSSAGPVRDDRFVPSSRYPPLDLEKCGLLGDGLLGEGIEKGGVGKR